MFIIAVWNNPDPMGGLIPFGGLTTTPAQPTALDSPKLLNNVAGKYPIRILSNDTHQFPSSCHIEE